MSRPLIVVGDRTSHGGTVISGSASSGDEGVYIARIGDKVTCPKKGHGGVTVIATGDPTFIVDGSPVARHGDQTACGAVLLASHFAIFVDEGGGSSGGVQAEGAAAAAATATAASEVIRDVEVASYDDKHAVRFQAIDPETGEPLPKCAYSLVFADGTQGGGVTDKNGFTRPIEVSDPGQVSVHFAFKASTGTDLEREDLA